MSYKFWLRIFFDIVLFFALVYGAWYLILPLAIIAYWIFPIYIEIIIVGVGFDALYGMTPETGLWGYAGTILSFVLSFLMTYLKKNVRK